VGAYRYGRPHVGYQALMANALLTYPWALGYVTELLSGQFHAPFGRSSHHQVWSEAMVVAPLVRGLLGIEAGDGGRRVSFAPQLPGDWDRLRVGNVTVGESVLDLAIERSAGRMEITVRTTRGTPPAVALAPGFPLDARVRSVTVDGMETAFRTRREGDVQRVELELAGAGPAARRIAMTYDEGTEVFARAQLPEAGSASEGLRILRCRAEDGALRLTLEGVAGRTYDVGVRTPRRIASVPGVAVTPAARGADLRVTFDGAAGRYVRRAIVLPLQ
jgi:hypothetical protein